jgi:pimeloyl-ACP methyl ester carboxylesterase
VLSFRHSGWRGTGKEQTRVRDWSHNRFKHPTSSVHGRGRSGQRGLAVGIGLVALAYAAFVAVMARVTAQDILHPKRWRTNERWPGVPYAATRDLIPCDLPGATCQKRHGLLVVDPSPHGATPGQLSPLRTGDTILSVAGIPATPVQALRLASFLASTAAGTTVPFRIHRDGPSGGIIELSIELPAAVLDPSDLDLAYEPVTFTGASGARIHGWYLPPPLRQDRPAPALLYVHGRQRNRRHIGLTDLALPAHRRGYGLLLIDLFGSGDSDGSVDFWGNDEVGLAMRFLTGRPEIDPTRIGVVGVSFGGIKALQAASDPHLNVGALAILAAADTTPRYIRLIAPPDELPKFLRTRLMCGMTLPSWLVESGRPLVNWWFRRATGRCLSEVEPARSASRVTCPVFLAHGTADRTFSPAAAQRIFAKIQSPKVFYPVVGHDHFTTVQSGEPLFRNLFAFLDEYLVSPDLAPVNLTEQHRAPIPVPETWIRLEGELDPELSSPAAD